MSTVDQPNLAPAIESLFTRLRRRIRAYVWAEGLAAAIILLGLWFWGSLGFDWVFEPPVPLRIAILIAVGLALLVIVYREIVRRAFVRLADRSMAMVLERRFGHFRESLLTLVELTEAPEHGAEFNADMLASTRADALAGAGDVALGEVFNLRPLVRKVIAAVVLIATVSAFGLLATDAFGLWARRTLLMSNELWPRKTHLSVEGFDQNRRAKIARGSDFELIVKADARPGRVVPELVQVRHTTSDGARGRENMSRKGQSAPGSDPFQEYHFTFKRELAARELFIHGGDDREGPFYLDVVDSPTVSQMVLHCEYPAYMNREPREIPVAGVVQLPRGTLATIHGQANKDLVHVQIDDLSDESSPQTHEVAIQNQSGPQARAFEYQLGPLDTDKSLAFTLLDTDGIRSRDPIRLALTAVPDEPPQVDVELKGIGTAITPSARMPAAGTASDDYGVARLQFEFRVDEGESRRQDLAARPGGQNRVSVEEVFDVEPLKLVPKQRFHFVIQAADTDTLSAQPNVGASQKYALDVVTPEQLRALLEARELMLRRRFETIIAEMTETRDTLARLTFDPIAPAGKPVTQPAAPPAAPSGGKVNPKTFANQAPATRGVEPGDELDDPKRALPEQPEEVKLARRLVQAERIVQNSERSANETLNLATAFDDIRAELVNNRVDTEELKSRLKEGIADPLRTIGERQFPELEVRLGVLKQRLNDAKGGPEAQSAALAQADLILINMKQILDKMIELETFNELLDRLRAIIALQDTINEQTKEKQKQKARNLLEE